ncbi:helix-turn-helix domain-containing protein [Haloferula chungangensis]|uniref:Helix-turn-helix domain-containing protein n=1 Tax=Haloferula chungangensis TaxID=1048331 RepID=A0ABW2L6N5_9BACT
MPTTPVRTGTLAKAALSHFAALLRIQRKERNLTLDELADRLGISTPTVRKILDGSPNVAIGSYFEAARILGVPLFDSDQDRFAINAARTEKLDSLLPKRVRTRHPEIDDDF